MYLKLVLATCILAFCAVVFSASARLSDAGLGCENWPACYEENALKQRQPYKAGAPRTHTSWQWKLQNLAGLLLGIMAVGVCGISWRKRKELRQSPLLPTLLLGMMVFMGLFGMWAFSHLSRPVIVEVHLAGGVALLILVVWIALQQTATDRVSATSEARKLRGLALSGLILALVQIMLGGWVSSNFAALACTDFPLCNGALLPTMDFSYRLTSDGLPLSPESLTAIHWMHRVGALITIFYLGWLSFKVMAVAKLKPVGTIVLGLLALEFALGIANVLGLSLMGAVMHNAVAMLLVVILVILNFRIRQ